MAVLWRTRNRSGDGWKLSGATTSRGTSHGGCAAFRPRCWPATSAVAGRRGEWAWEAACECLLAEEDAGTKSQGASPGVAGVNEKGPFT